MGKHDNMHFQDRINLFNSTGGKSPVISIIRNMNNCLLSEKGQSTTLFLSLETKGAIMCQRKNWEVGKNIMIFIHPSSISSSFPEDYRMQQTRKETLWFAPKEEPCLTTALVSPIRWTPEISSKAGGPWLTRSPFFSQMFPWPSQDKTESELNYSQPICITSHMQTVSITEASVDF